MNAIKLLLLMVLLAKGNTHCTLFLLLIQKNVLPLQALWKI